MISQHLPEIPFWKMALALARRLPLASSLRSTIADPDAQNDDDDADDVELNFHATDDDEGEDEVMSDDSHHQPRQPSSSSSPSLCCSLPPPSSAASPPPTKSVSPIFAASIALRTTSSPSRQKQPPPLPIPIPHLTKKSRGRRVPTSEPTSPASLTSPASSPGKPSTRNYICQAKDCGKRFSRGEHLKRHVRSIHTNEKREHFFPFCCKVIVYRPFAKLSNAHKPTAERFIASHYLPSFTETDLTVFQ